MFLNSEMVQNTLQLKRIFNKLQEQPKNAMPKLFETLKIELPCGNSFRQKFSIILVCTIGIAEMQDVKSLFLLHLAPERLKKGETRLRVTLQDKTVRLVRYAVHYYIYPQTAGSSAVNSLLRNPKYELPVKLLQTRKEDTDDGRNMQRFGEEKLENSIPIGPSGNLKQIVSVVTDGVDIKYGFPQMVFSFGFLVRAIGIQTLYFAEIISTDLRYTEASMSMHTSELRSDTAAPLSKARCRLIEIIKSRRTIIKGDAQELTGRLHLEFTDQITRQIRYRNSKPPAFVWNTSVENFNPIFHA
uniref:Uncharacterized protein n=1 Tax=Tetranychus urticae TaxID=32264 RepID=T1K5V1_TETUR